MDTVSGLWLECSKGIDMLVIEREIGQSLYIGEELQAEVKVLGLTASGRIRIGVQAPRTVAIHRNKSCFATTGFSHSIGGCI